MFVLCYFCNIDMYIFDKINVLYLLTYLLTYFTCRVIVFNSFIHLSLRRALFQLPSNMHSIIPFSIPLSHLTLPIAFYHAQYHLLFHSIVSSHSSNCLLQCTVSSPFPFNRLISLFHLKKKNKKNALFDPLDRRPTLRLGKCR